MKVDNTAYFFTFLLADVMRFHLCNLQRGKISACIWNKAYDSTLFALAYCFIKPGLEAVQFCTAGIAF